MTTVYVINNGGIHPARMLTPGSKCPVCELKTGELVTSRIGEKVFRDLSSAVQKMESSEVKKYEIHL